MDYGLYMATDHNILSPTPVRVFFVLLCVFVRVWIGSSCSTNTYPLLTFVDLQLVHPTQRPTMSERVAIVGAGVAGLSAASKHPDKFLVTVFDKGIDRD